MQQRQADAIKKKIVFLDPVAICENRHYGPMLWKDDHDEFKNYSKSKEKLSLQKEAHKDIIRTVGNYISLQMQRWLDRDVIWAPFSKCSLNHLV